MISSGLLKYLTAIPIYLVGSSLFYSTSVFRKVGYEALFYDILPETFHHFSHNGMEENKLFAPREGDTFAPGSLPLNHTTAMGRCFVDPTRYRRHFRRQICVDSDQYNISYHLIAKSGSSSGRFIMGSSFGGKGKNCHRRRLRNRTDTFEQFTFVREPTSRFISAYQESLLRIFVKNVPIPPEYAEFFHGALGDVTRMRQYRRLTNKEDGRRQVTLAFETFVRDYDARNPFEGHLALQVPRLAALRSGLAAQLDHVLDVHDMTEFFTNLALRVGAPPPNLRHLYNRGVSGIQLELLTPATRRKICQLSAIDYCCLNYPLPEACQDAVSCQWVAKPELTDELLIEAISPFPPPPPPPSDNADAGTG